MSSEDWYWLYDADGNLIEEKVLAELMDYIAILQEVPQVYAHVTDGRITKPQAYAFEVINAYEEDVKGLIDTAVQEALRQKEEAHDDDDDDPPVDEQ